MIKEDKMQIKAVLLDFGGVIAEEGFREGLYAIAGRFGLDRKRFFQLANEAVYNSGYVTGTGSEKDYWNMVREHSGIVAADEELRQEILSRFIPRDWMLEAADNIHRRGVTVAILSDQSDWLDQLDSLYHFFQHFDAVFNSFHLGKAKRDPTLFTDVLAELNTEGRNTLFIDDNIDHIDRATSAGLLVHHFTTRIEFMRKLKEFGLL